MQIRALTLDDDLAAAGAIVVDAYSNIPGGWSVDEEGYRDELLDVAHRIEVAEVAGAFDDDGTVLGCVTYSPNGSPLYEHDDPEAASFRMLAVAPSAQGRGVGEALVRWVIERARADGVPRLRLYTTPPMTVAQRIYARFGFHRDADDDWTFAPDRTLLGYVLDL